MKATINGKRFDTATAILVGAAHTPRRSTGSRSPMMHEWEASLYVTPKSREYFIAGHGGPMTCFAGRPGFWSGAAIIPLSLDDAIRWAGQYLILREYQMAFSAEERARWPID